MTSTEKETRSLPSVEEIQQNWHELASRVGQLEADKSALAHENKLLRSLLERVIEHRQKSHGELVLLLSGLVSKLPINDVGVVVARLVEHNSHVSEVLAALLKGKADAQMPQPTILKALDDTKRNLAGAVKPLVEELIQLDVPAEAEMLRSLTTKPDLFFTPAVVRASRCFVKGQVPRERVVREFGEPALIFFNDLTTDPKLNPRPKPDEIVLAFKNDFDALFQQNPNVIPDKRKDLAALHQKIQKSKAPSDQARAQRNAFQKLSFVLELLHYYENQNTEAPDVIFAQRLPTITEQLVLTNPQDNLDEKLIGQAEELLAFVIAPDHRQMIVNNMGKGGGSGRTLKYVLTLRAQKFPVTEDIRLNVIPEFVKHLIPAQKTSPTPAALVPVVRLLNPDMQKMVARAIMDTDRLKKDDANTLGKAVGKELGLTGLDHPVKGLEEIPPEMERQMAWEKIKDMITSRNEPHAIAAAFRERLHAKYDADEMKQSWVTLTEADPISLIRVFCALPYLEDGRTDPVARAVMETYVTRLTHEKYAGTYQKVLNSLRNMHKANPHSPTLQNFIALVRWVDTETANKLSTDIGMQVAA
jgi:hypothetical protein